MASAILAPRQPASRADPDVAWQLIVRMRPFRPARLSSPAIPVLTNPEPSRMPSKRPGRGCGCCRNTRPTSIEQTFAKIKHWMWEAQKRTSKDTWRHLGHRVETINFSRVARSSALSGCLGRLFRPIDELLMPLPAFKALKGDGDLASVSSPTAHPIFPRQHKFSTSISSNVPIGPDTVNVRASALNTASCSLQLFRAKYPPKPMN